MKRTSILLSFLAFVVAVAAFILAASNHIARKRDLFGYEEDDFDDELFDGDLDFYAEPLDHSESDLSVEAEGNTAPVGHTEAHPQEH